MPPKRIVIVGAAAAGLAVAESARSAGYRDELVMIGDEDHRPYDRPPLSKQLLRGEWQPARLALRSQDEFDSLGIHLRLGVPAGGLDVDGREVVLADGARIGYDAMVVATGVRPRRLPGTDGVAGIHVLRDLDDALALRTELTSGRRLVVVGAGVLGSEVAAVARALDVDVTLVDPLPLPMSRVVGDEVGRMLAELHREHGVDVRCGVGVRQVHQNAGAVESIELATGERVPADVVLVAIGATPAVEWLRDSPVPLGGPSPEEGAGGVLCAADGRAAAGVYAAGDVAAWQNPGTGSHTRIEHRLNATEQGQAVARTILDPSTPRTQSVPYFWSDQYDIKIQSYGLPAPGDGFAVVDGALADRRFVGLHHRDGMVTGALGVSMHRRLRDMRSRIGRPLEDAA